MKSTTYSISKKTTSVVSLESAELIYQEVLELLDKYDHITFDMNGVNSMTTSCAKSIFGRLYSHVGPTDFNKKIKFTNADREMQIIIHEGIVSFIENNK